MLLTLDQGACVRHCKVGMFMCPCVHVSMCACHMVGVPSTKRTSISMYPYIPGSFEPSFVSCPNATTLRPGFIDLSSPSENRSRNNRTDSRLWGILRVHPGSFFSRYLFRPRCSRCYASVCFRPCCAPRTIFVACPRIASRLTPGLCHTERYTVHPPTACLAMSVFPPERGF